MPEDTNAQNPTNPTGTDPKSPEGSSQTGQVDLKSLTPEQLAQVYENPNLYKHPRFAELSEAKKQRDDLIAQQKEADDKKLAAEGKLQELVDKKDGEIKELSQRLQTQAIDVAIERAASKAGVSDSEAALKLIDRGSIQIDPKTGEVSGVAEAVKTLTDSKPYLLGQAQAPTVGSPSNPGDANTQLKRFKLSQTQDHAFYEANKADIQRSMIAGLVEDDINAK